MHRSLTVRLVLGKVARETFVTFVENDCY